MYRDDDIHEAYYIDGQYRVDTSHNRPTRQIEPPLSWTPVLLTTIYIISPIDLLPDVVPVLGWGDDIFALVYLIWLLYMRLR